MEKKILIVDDAMFMRKSIRKILSEGGYANVEEARDGDEAIAMFGEYSPDLVLLDITMPGRSGLEVLEEICPLSARMVVNQVSQRMEQERISKIVTALKKLLDEKKQG